MVPRWEVFGLEQSPVTESLFSPSLRFAPNNPDSCRNLIAVLQANDRVRVSGCRNHIDTYAPTPHESGPDHWRFNCFLASYLMFVLRQNNDPLSILKARERFGTRIFKRVAAIGLLGIEHDEARRHDDLGDQETNDGGEINKGLM